MLRFIYATDLRNYPKLAQGMFTDRADQFANRLGWDVHVNAVGEEKDQYDLLNPLYVIWENEDGSHGGSMRFLPTMGSCMVNEHFLNLLTGPIVSPHIWECTRFCLSKGAKSQIAAALMLGGGELMTNFGVEHFVGVFDTRMTRIYGRIGSSPEVLGWSGEGKEALGVGLWRFEEDAKSKICAHTGITPQQLRQWFDLSFGARDPLPEFAKSA